MTSDDYLIAVARFASKLDEAQDDRPFELSLPELMRQSEDAGTCVAFRQQVATPEELEAKTGYLDLGYFPDPDKTRQLAWWLFYFDVLYAHDRLVLEEVCKPYHREQPLFRGVPKLFDHIRRRQHADSSRGEPDYELIDEAVVRSVGDSEVCALGLGGFAKIAPQLGPQIPAWGRSEFSSEPRYVKLDPRRWWNHEPRQLLQEAAIVPANPRWMGTMALFPGMSTFAAYDLSDHDPAVDMARHRDYHLRHIRKLEVIAQRRKPDYLTMMLEELPRADDPNGLMVSRCIHLDTRALVGTPMKAARLSHIDLAINVYRGDHRAARMNESLQKGKVRDADLRTHLYRIENVPFPALFALAEMFFRSRSLLQEWCAALGLL